MKLQGEALRNDQEILFKFLHEHGMGKRVFHFYNVLFVYEFAIAEQIIKIAARKIQDYRDLHRWLKDVRRHRSTTAAEFVKYQVNGYKAAISILLDGHPEKCRAIAHMNIIQQYLHIERAIFANPSPELMQTIKEMNAEYEND